MSLPKGRIIAVTAFGKRTRKRSHCTLGTDVILLSGEGLDLNGDPLQHLNDVDLLGQVLEHGGTTAPQIGFQDDSEPLLIVS